MSISLLLPIWLAVAGPAMPGPGTAKPAVHVWLNSDGQFARGDQARVYVKTADDGYLVVLRADDQGRIRVLYPIDPNDEDFVRATDKTEIRGPDNRKAFLVDDKAGGGLVVAAYSQDPFTFDGFVRNGHWDLTALSPVGAKRDPEAAVMDVVQTMSGGRPFEVDEAKYVTSPRARAMPYRVGLGFFAPWYYDPWYFDPWCIACSPYLGFGGTYIIGRSVDRDAPAGRAFRERPADRDAPAARVARGRR